MIVRRTEEVELGRPVTRMRREPVCGSITLAALFSTHCVKPGAGTSSIVYCAVDPGIVRQRAGVVPGWLTGVGAAASCRAQRAQ